MITLDITLLIQIANIIILIFVLNAVLYRPIRTIIAKREEKFNALEEEISTFASNVTLRQEEVNKKLNSARAKAKELLDAARGEAQGAGAETLAGIRQETSAYKADQLAGIKKEITTAREELKGQVQGFANDIAGKILGRAL